MIKDNISFFKHDRYKYMIIAELPAARVRLDNNILRNMKKLVDKLFSRTTYLKEALIHVFPEEIERDTLAMARATVVHPGLLLPTEYLLRLTHNHIYCYLSQFSPAYQLCITLTEVRLLPSPQPGLLQLRVLDRHRSGLEFSLDFDSQQVCQAWAEAILGRIDLLEVDDPNQPKPDPDDQEPTDAIPRRYISFNLGKVELLLYRDLDLPVWVSAQADKL
jgi:hypothetical protein